MKLRSASRRLKHANLLDLPPGWLTCLILALEKRASLKALSRTCKNVHDLMFSQAALVPKLWLQTEGLGTPLHVAALAMAEAATSNLEVEFAVTSNDPEKVKTRLVNTFSKSASLHAKRTGAALKRAPVPYQLQCITTVSMCTNGYDDWPRLDSLIPDFLVKRCPNLRGLYMTYLAIGPSDHGAAAQPLASRAVARPLTFTSLQHLILNAVICRHPEDINRAKQQLLNLPSLTSLYVCSQEEDMEDVYRATIDKYSSQLRHLQVLSFTALPWSPGTKFSHLQHLNLGHRLKVDSDAVMQQLVQATRSVCRLELHSISGLKTSFAQEPCSWQELTVDDLYVDQLAKLPLASCTRLGCRFIFLGCQGSEMATPAQVAAGVAAGQAAGGLQFNEDMDIKLCTGDLQLISAAQSLWEQPNACAEIGVYSSDPADDAPWSEARPVLAALGQHLRCKWMGVGEHLSWTFNLAQLPELLPHVEGFKCERVYWKELAEMCRAATRPFTLHVTFASWQDDEKQELEQALQEAGHQLVTLQVEFE